MKSILLNITLLFIAFISVNGQEKDTTKAVKTVFLQKEQGSFNWKTTPADTDFYSIQDYMPFYKNFLSHLGNGMSATYSLMPSFNSSLPFWLSPMEIYFKDIDNRYFQTHYPFTFARLTANTNRTYNEEGMMLIHTQNIKPNWNIAFIGQTDKQTGHIQRQDNRLHYLYGSTRFDGKKYKLDANYFFSKIKAKENGGVSNLNFIIDSLYPIENAEIYRSDATNNYIYNKAQAQQSICLNYKNDSLSQKIKPFLVHRFSYIRARKIYNDVIDTTGFYTNTFDDTAKTYDSLYFRNVENRIGLAFANSMTSGKGIYVYGISSMQMYYSYAHSNKADNYGSGLQLFYNDSSWNMYFTFETYLSGYLRNNQSAELKITKNISLFNKQAQIFILPAFNSVKQDYFYSQLCTNHYQWDTNLPDLSEISAQLGIEDNLNGLYLNIKQTKNAVYLNKHSIAQTDSSSIFYAGIVLRKLFKLGHFRLSNNFMFQTISDSVISVPDFAGYHSLYYENELFKKVLGLQIGGEVYYTAKYRAPSYNPALGAYYFSYGTELGNYPYINVFLNLKLKRARFFFKVEHLNYKWNGGNYCLIQNYPIPPRSLKFGIFWSFYD